MPEEINPANIPAMIQTAIFIKRRYKYKDTLKFKISFLQDKKIRVTYQVTNNSNTRIRTILCN